jgi:hypothetical protein
VIRRLVILTLLMGALMALPDLFDSGVPRSVSAILASYFEEANERLKQIVLHPPGTTQSSQAFRQARAAEQVAHVRRITVELKAKSSGWVGTEMTAAFRAGRRRGEQQAIDAGVRPAGSAFEGSFAQVDRKTANVFAADVYQRRVMETYQDLAKAADSMGDRTATLLRATAQQGLGERDINQILAVGAIEGKPRDTIKRLREELQKVHGDTVEVNGRNYDVGKYAETVARTKTRQATVIARHERLGELGLDLVSIVGKTSDSFCTGYLGQVFSLSGQSTKYPPLASTPGGGPPYHPNCSKSTRPFVEALATDKQLDAAEIVEPKLLNVSSAEAQRRYKDLQVRQQVEKKYIASTKGA